MPVIRKTDGDMSRRSVAPVDRGLVGFGVDSERCPSPKRLGS